MTQECPGRASDPDPVPEPYRVGYPQALWEKERRLLSARRRTEITGDRPPADTLGIALSGGGIRSATFCLGVLQAIARAGLLGRIDYLSTVSGGGYLGSFLGRLFTRREVASVGDVEDALLRHERQATTKNDLPDVTRWLRENGRYLSPNGSGDLLLAGASVLRNWTALQIVLLTFLLLGFLTLQLLRVALEAGGLLTPPGLPDGIAWNPGMLAVAIFVLFAFPLGWAYWMIGKTRPLQHPVFGLAAALLASAYFSLAPAEEPPWLRVACRAVAVAALVAATAWALASLYSRWRGKSLLPKNAPPAEVRIFRHSDERHALSQALKVALIVCAGILAFVFIDWIGAQLYEWILRKATVRLPLSITSVAAAMASLVAFGKRITVAFGSGVHGKRIRVPAAVLATIAAILLSLVILVGCDALSHAVAWRFGPTMGLRPILPVLTAWSLALAFSLLFGICWIFLNGSSQHSLYSARLTRAYLGASNPLRRNPKYMSVTEVLPGDNIGLEDYWPAEEKTAKTLYSKGTPLHLINCTFNETLDSKSNVQQQDRKGLGFTLGPRSISVGVKHHAIFDGYPEAEDASVPVTTTPEKGFRIFETKQKVKDNGTEETMVKAKETWTLGERLTLGYWTGISGAAFSTGLGARTNIGLSLLCGFANVRLGYWWDSQIPPSRRKNTGRVGFSAGFLPGLFPVQRRFFDELLARFHGPARQQWYLSDGGHFENLGAYELIRRQLPRIVVVDADADPDYSFGDVANLVRKARLDFGAEIRFLSAAELDEKVHKDVRRFFGTLEQLRRGKWDKEPVDDPNDSGPRRTLDPSDRGRYSLAHAALASVDYAGSSDRAWLLYLKPTLTGDESADVTRYHSEHPDFPHETTADQFFDEAQWESYRKLGDELAMNLLSPRSTPAQPGWLPFDFVRGA